jgi:hypothetical protein
MVQKIMCGHTWTTWNYNVPKATRSCVKHKVAPTTDLKYNRWSGHRWTHNLVNKTNGETARKRPPIDNYTQECERQFTDWQRKILDMYRHSFGHLRNSPENSDCIRKRERTLKVKMDTSGELVEFPGHTECKKEITADVVSHVCIYKVKKWVAVVLVHSFV